MALTVSLANPAGTDSCSLVLVANIVGANTLSTSDTARLCTNSGPGAKRCGASFPISDSSDPVGNYKWTVITV